MGGNQPTLVDFIDSFLNGLSGTLKDHLAPSKLTVELESSIKWASEIDKRLFHWNGSREEEERYIYCTQFEPCMASCQVRSPTPNAASSSLASQTNLSVPSERRPTGVTLQSDSSSLIFQALRHDVDTNMMGFQIAIRLQSCREELPQPISTSATDGRFVCNVAHQTSTVTFVFEDVHWEEIRFLLYDSATEPVSNKCLHFITFNKCQTEPV